MNWQSAATIAAGLYATGAMFVGFWFIAEGQISARAGRLTVLWPVWGLYCWFLEPLFREEK